MIEDISVIPERALVLWVEWLCPPNAYVGTRTHSVLVFGRGTFGMWLWLDEVMRVGRMVALVPL